MSRLRGFWWQPTYSAKQLRVTYLVALALIAGCLLVFAIAMLNIIPTQNDDAYIVNLSGRQRMLSQRMFKVLLLISLNPASERSEVYREELRDLNVQWVNAQEYLVGTNRTPRIPRSDSILQMYRRQEPYFQRMVETYDLVTRLPYDDTITLQRAIAVIGENEESFLDLQEHITNRFQHESDSRLKMLSATATGSFIVIFLLIIVEAILVFRPMTRQIERYIATLTYANEELVAVTKAKDLSELNLRRLLSIYPDIALVFDERGVYIDVFTSSEELLYLDRASLMGKSLHEVFPPEEADFFYGAIQTTFKTRETNSFTYSLDLPKGPIWFRGTLTFFENAGGDHHVVMFIRDITKEIEAEAKERQHQQKLLQTIIETQESERSRIASDMHDGIGQMFAVLKLNIARLKREEEKELFDDALDSIDTIAAELRLIARNLMPVSLQRFGLNATLGSESKILEQRFGIKIDCTTQTKRDRYSEAIEICIYRIAQELLVNIVKHSHAKNAKVCLLETEENKLVLEISDDGRGFATHKRSMAGEGRGLMNIQSRVHAFGGSLRIDSSEDQGSNIRIEIPISEQEPL